MNTSWTLYLIASFAFVGPVCAQECSGGYGGGTDATGNQCNSAAAEAYITGASPQQAAKMGRIEQSKPIEARTGPTAKMSGALAKLTVVAQGVSGFPKFVALPVAPVKTSKTKIEVRDASSCSGGAGDGMDATGNECGENPLAEQNVVIMGVSPIEKSGRAPTRRTSDGAHPYQQDSRRAKSGAA